MGFRAERRGFRAAEEAVRPEGRLEVRVAVYRTAGGELTAEFVEGVLVRFAGE